MFDLMVDVMQTEEHRKAFGKRLKELRNQRRWTYKEVTAKIGLQLSQFNKYEFGMHVPPISNVRLLERFQALVHASRQSRKQLSA